MRYAWHLKEAYFGTDRNEPPELRAQPGVGGGVRNPPIAARGIDLILACLRRWDRRTAARVTQFIAISRTVQQRIHESYDRDSVVVYPPVDTDFYTPAAIEREPYYLCVSALVPYKRLDLAIDACNRLGRRLIVIGSGPSEDRLRARAGSTVQFLGWQSDDVIRSHYRRCSALLFPGEEDFGIVPLEAQACGTPVIAYGSGGAAETVMPAGESQPGTGLLFEHQTIESLVDAIRCLEGNPNQVDCRRARQNAERFTIARFIREIQKLAERFASRRLCVALPRTRHAA